MTAEAPVPGTHPGDVILRDVTLRDGLQLTGKTLGTAHKVSVVRELLALGMPSIEIGSLARPDLVPPLANSLAVVAALTAEELERCWLWVATPRHVERAVAAGARNVQYCLSVSDAHNRANIGRDTEASIAAMPAASEIAHAAGGASNSVSPPRSPARSRARSHRTASSPSPTTPAPRARRTSSSVTRWGRRCRRRWLTSSAGSVPRRRGGASSSTVTTPGVREWRTRWPPSPPERTWSTERSAAWGLPVRSGRQRQHGDGGPSVRTAPDLAEPNCPQSVGRRLGRTPQRARRTQPLQGRAGDPLPGHRLRVDESRGVRRRARTLMICDL